MATAARIFKDQAAGDYTVMLNNPKGKAALDYYIRLAREAGHPKTAALDQAEVIQNMVTGKAAHIMMVIAAWSQMDDPTKSAVVDKIEFAVPPHVPRRAARAWARTLARRHLQERPGRSQARDRRVPALVPDQDAQIATAKFGRHSDQRRGLPRSDRRGAQATAG